MENKIEKETRWLRDDVVEMEGAIKFYRLLAKDAYEREDQEELKFQARSLLSILGEKDLFPADLDEAGNGMKEFILSLEKLGEGRFKKKEERELAYYKSRCYSYEVSHILREFIKNRRQ